MTSRTRPTIATPLPFETEAAGAAAGIDMSKRALLAAGNPSWEIRGWNPEGVEETGVGTVRPLGDSGAGKAGAGMPNNVRGVPEGGPGVRPAGGPGIRAPD